MRLSLLSRKEFQIFKNVSFDLRAIATRQKAVFTVLVVLLFKESLFMEIGNVSKVGGILNISKCGKYF